MNAQILTLDDLVHVSEPAWPLVAVALEAAPHPVEVLPRTLENAERTLLGIQLTTRSTLGAVAFYTGGILIDRGWLRLLGSGHERLGRDVMRWNRDTESAPRLDRALLVADDVLGGFFALNGGSLPGELHQVHYLDPTTAAWTDLELGYTEFLHWACSSEFSAFYGPQRVRLGSWEEATREVPGDGVLLGPDDRRIVPVETAWAMHHAVIGRCC